jgi:nitrite reductase/ring-hydroxylating ferredoxin subunit
MTTHDVGAVADFAERVVTLVRAGDREIGVVRWNGEVYAISNVCTHQRGPLCRGTLSARLTAAAPGTMELDEETPVLACPWHGWEFDLRSGRALWDERYAVRTFSVSVEGGRVLVDMKRQGS